MHPAARCVEKGCGASLAAWALALLIGLPPPGVATAEDEDVLRERLTEREDQRRPLEPWSIEVAGRPLTVSGEYELAPGYIRRQLIDETTEQPDRLLLEQGLEAEAFYSFGPALSVFGQLRVGMEHDLFQDSLEPVSDLFVERGELWLYSEDLFGSRLDLDLGRLHFEDDRRLWWDEDLDAVRLAYELPSAELTLAVAQELAPERSDSDAIDPENDQVLRLIGEASWDLGPGHAAEVFLLHQWDHSPGDHSPTGGPQAGDPSDARLTWSGARLLGIFDLGPAGLLGYWLDSAWVRGEERLVASLGNTPGGVRQEVSGWALDAGLNWILAIAREPRLYAGYARGSGDPTPGSGTDYAFRQTGLETNEAGFGGVERFPHYGVLLDPELSNLGVVTLGTGLSLLRSSSLDLVYHGYRLVEPAPALRDARLEVSLTGRERALGHEIDLVLAVEEWERFELDLIGSAFRAGPAFGEAEDEWSYAAFLAVRVAF